MVSKDLFTHISELSDIVISLGTMFNLLVCRTTLNLLICFSNTSVSAPWDFEYSFKTCPALVGGTLMPLVYWMVLIDNDIQHQLLKVPIQYIGNRQPLLSLWCIVDPLLCFIDDFGAFHCSLPCKLYVLSQVKAYIIFLLRIFNSLY